MFGQGKAIELGLRRDKLLMIDITLSMIWGLEIGTICIQGRHSTFVEILRCLCK